jgi:hypothetical protein
MMDRSTLPRAWTQVWTHVWPQAWPRIAACIAAAGLLVATLAGCGGTGDDARTKADRPDVPPDTTLFTKLPSSYTNVDFTNEITYTKETNVFTYRNYHNGGGVAIGDLNGDGRQDVYFTANQEPNRLYLNRGDWWFEDVTEAAGVGGKRAWATGVSIADVNGDGRLDIYVCNSGDISGDDKQNELYVNQGTNEEGVPQFEEKAAEYGIDDQGYSTHAAFFDYDRDGDLDLYLLNNSFTPVSKFDLRDDLRSVRDEEGGDKLYENRGGTFVDVSEEAGIYGSEIGFGLGVTVGDVNRDGWQDIYVSNDFFERDYLYVNNGDGTFREVLQDQMRHTSLSSMGADMADINNDARPDLFVTDMLPDTDHRLKTTTKFKSWNVYQAMVRDGYYHQIMRNTLQLNNGNGTFSEISQVAGVHATDWSWGALIADFDLDGHKDIFVANGVYKDVTDQDFINYLANEETATRMKERGKVEFLNLIDQIPSNKQPNYAFRNDGDLTFTDAAETWGLATPSFSNGSAYGDLDNDGDLDLVVNNLNHESFIYRNEAARRDNHYLQVKLEGEGDNPFGLGAQVTIQTDTSTIYLEQMPMRGFQSTVGPVLTAGVGAADTLDRVTVAWPDSTVQQLTDVPTDQRLTVRQSEARPARTADRPAPSVPEPAGQPLQEVSDRVPLDLEQEENRFVDFNREGLIPKKVSTEGPRLAVADVNGDGRDDVYVGGPKGEAGRLLLQQADGRFTPTSEETFRRDKISEDVQATFFDADGDGDLDLYVVSGGNEFSPSAPALQDRLYLNDGRGRFRKAGGRLPGVNQSGSVVAAHDFDGDGDTDLFVGGRVVPWSYGKTPESTLLENDGSGRFTAVTEETAPGLQDVGMVTDAVWADVSGDRRKDLVVVGEWMPITIFETTGAGLERTRPEGLRHSSGWWNRVVARDFDGDGDTDLVAGNFGLNSRLDASPEKPTSMYVSDFDQNGYSEPILTVYREGKEVPFVLRGPITSQLSMLKSKFPSHESYAGTPIGEVFTDEQLRRATTKRVHTFASSYVENTGDGFELRELPLRAQFSPIYGILPADVNGDGILDLVTAGNFHGLKPNLGRMDASYGLVLRGDGSGHFTPVPARESGFLVSGEARDVERLTSTRYGRLIVVARNDAPAQIFRPRQPQ